MGVVEVLESQVSQGYRAASRFEYHLAYLDQFGEHIQSRGCRASSVRCPLNYGLFSEPNWPAFLLDLLPTGAARAHWLRRLELVDGPGSDLDLLLKGAVNPPGNVRVQPGENLFLDGANSQRGFEYREVVDRGVDFIEYAESLGAIVAGSSGAQGVAPKFLLAEDQSGKWHGDGAIADSQIQTSWLVKFPRGKKLRDFQILRVESQYYEIARELGVKVKGPLRWDRDTLFIPRFDRDRDEQGRLVRLGLESLLSAMGVCDFGVHRNHEDYVSVIRRHSSQPKLDIQEYVFRDFLNVILGNTDNHGRNTALLKGTDGSIRISPLYDFAPMVLDEEGIPRATKWKNEVYQVPNFEHLQACLIENGLTRDEAGQFFRLSHEKLQNTDTLLDRHGVEAEVKEIVTKKYDPFMLALARYVRAL